MTLTFITPLIAMWVLLNNVVTELALRASVWFTVNLPVLIPVHPAILPMAACVPVNGDLVKGGGLGSVLTRLAGALGGLLEPLAILFTVLAAVAAIALSVTDKAAKWYKILLVPFSVLIGLAFLIFAATALWKIFQNLC